MKMYQDPEMQDILDEFCTESLQLLEEIDIVIEEFSDDLKNLTKLEEYGQKIDRIMGAAKSIEVNKIGSFAELGKTISYKASQTNNEELLNIVSAVLADTTEFMIEAIENLKEHKNEDIDSFNDEAFIKRLRWLRDKFSSIERSSVAIADNGDQVGQGSINELLSKMGI